MIENFCTLSDSKYILQGLALYKSLIKVKGKFTLHYLCLDDKIYNSLEKLNLPNLNLVKLKELEENDIQLKEFKENPNSFWGDRYTQYCWALAPYFINYILSEKKVDNILYCDSDIYFYNNFELIEKEIGEKSIGIVKHRITPKEYEKPGIYNVGIVYFKGDKVGRNCANFWKNLLLEPNNRYSEKYGTCGDQKYLELFPLIYGNLVCIIDKTVGHLAPWNYKYHDYLVEGEIKYKELNINQSLVYLHFARFKINEDLQSYTCNYHGSSWLQTAHPHLKKYYDIYFKEQIELKKEYSL
jgi:hypothetical protein